ncbi:hypothetical protein LTR10_019292 [Elasticomyces elasticus]|uniref:Uncharacterized protein n=1 Tax=Exophiala sideris TaxID=1016849 RepID=A0ABR0IWY9_9EURO|nr:hypothetical protein LTR10_019292 [Elasticomyces elasticus]KAK5021970.1 hypothetical protein LTS07_010552 [Exophiala sideris]KAK5026033.1 hypothetical protein LTR13_010190 [Exophiala sideris]KAK5050720.1 hypothetical protein LTR69_010576 [Exophiala sideris]KAK5177205.1 hypothetical protein LTR44_010333 [Eurotiomycetes sp. CCFEE 6388]
MSSAEVLETSDATPDVAALETPNDGEAETVDGESAAQGRRPRRHRGRHAKDPLGQSIQYRCQGTNDFEEQLREYLTNPTGDAEHMTLEFSFPVTAAFMVPAREPKGNRPVHDRTPYMYSAFNKTAISVADALQHNGDPKEQMLTQKAISKSLVEAVQEADGYHYSFHNYWVSREDQACRFSYFCNDSVLNKGRAANEGASKIRQGVKVRKPVWDCQGTVAVKFSLTKMSLEVQYKHIPMHPTFDERAPAPRNGSKRKRMLEIFHPEKLPKFRPREKKKKPEAPNKEPAKRGRPRKVRDPAVQPANESASQSTRDSSLQPLFDFLGSAEQAVNGPAETPGAADRATESAPAVADQNGSGQNDTPAASVTTETGRQHAYPGMMSGFMAGEQITWSNKKRPRARKSTAAASAVATTSSTPIQTSRGAPLSEVEALKLKLLEAERKIKDLETEKLKTVTPITWNTPPPSMQQPVPENGYPHPFYPPQPPQYPPQQWPYAAPHHQQAIPPGHHPPIQPPGPAPIPQAAPAPASATKPAPFYGFVPNPEAPAAFQALNARKIQPKRNNPSPSQNEQTPSHPQSRQPGPSLTQLPAPSNQPPNMHLAQGTPEAQSTPPQPAMVQHTSEQSQNI